MERSPTNHFFLPFFFIFFFFFLGHQLKLVTAQNESVVKVGVILDFESLPGKKDWASISMAIDDFYATQGNITGRVILQPRDSQKDIVGAASAALDLIKNEKVQAIIGPITSLQTKFVAELGNKTQVPIVSFSASSPSLSSIATPYFVRATLNDSSQVAAIAAIIKLYGWHEVVPIYEDTDYGSSIVPFLIDAFNSIDTRVPYRSVMPANASDSWLQAELYKLMSMQTRVFVVHMMPILGSRLFRQAQAAGLMSKGYVWITTDALTNTLETLGPSVLSSMEGVLGVQPYVPTSKSLSNFTARWHARFLRDHPTVVPADPTIYQLWAYDATWAIALAANAAANKLRPTFQPVPLATDNSTNLSRLGVSNTGPHFLAAILNSQFRGLTGQFRLVDSQLQSSAFEIVNFNGKGGRRGVGFWSPVVAGIVKDLKNVSAVGLKTVIWPGDLVEVPKGWEMPTMGRKLKIGVPVKHGFNEFVNVEIDEASGRLKVTGYCIDIFEEVMKTLPYPVLYYYEAVDRYSYDDLVTAVYDKRFDAIVGDTTILANRSLYVDFTLPYTESGVSMIVPVKEDKSKNAWIFLQPLTTDLWLASLAFFFFTGFVIWVIEHRINREFRGPPSQQMGTIFYFAFSTMVFAHRERLESNLSRFAVIIWVFVVLILTSSYTASLTSLLTVQQLQPSVTDINQLVKNGDYIGYQEGTFVNGLLEQQLKFDANKLRNYSTPAQYAEALQLGSKNGGVAAIFDEIPYLKLFLSDRCDDYAMVGRTYKTDGFGFVFPRGSPLVYDISRAILNVTEGNTMTNIERKWFGDQTTCPTDATSFTSNSLNFRSFSGLFLVTGCVSLLAVILFLVTFIYKEGEELKKAAAQGTLWRKMVEWAQYYDRKDLSSHTFKDHAASENEGGANNGNLVRDDVVVPDVVCEGLQSPVSAISYFSDLNLSSPDEGNGSFRDDNLVRDDVVVPDVVCEVLQSPVSVISNFSDSNFSSPDMFREGSKPVENAVDITEIRVGN